MRLMGRFCSESSPVSRVLNFCPARIPANNRIVVPEFPASSARQLLFNPRAPRPVTLTESFSTFTSAPSAFMHASVLWQSTAAEKWRNSLVPSAKPASIAYRCEIDLSPGSSTPPVIALAGTIVSFFTRKFYHANCCGPRTASHSSPRPCLLSIAPTTVVSPTGAGLLSTHPLKTLASSFRHQQYRHPPRLLFRHQQYRSFRPEQAGAFAVLLRSCEAAGPRSGAISLRFSSPSKYNLKTTPIKTKTARKPPSRFYYRMCWKVEIIVSGR